MKETEHFRVQELVKKIESHPHREALQADLQQKNAYNPFSDETYSYAKQFQKCNAQNAFFLGIKELSGTCGHLLVESESSQHFSQWRLDALSISRTTSSRRGDLEVLGTANLRHRKSISWPTMRGGDVSKRNLKEFTIASNEIQHFVSRNSELVGPRRSASR